MDGESRTTMARWLAVLGFALLVGCGDDDDGGRRATPSPTAVPTASPTPVSGEEAEPFDLSLAVELGWLCLQSYQMLTDFEQGDSFALPAPYTLREQFLTPEHWPGEDGSDPVPIAYVATAGEAIYVVFRGTKTIAEWISDATLNQVPYDFVSGGGASEAGFTAIYASIRSAIVETVNALAAGGAYDALYVTGHSLGAALATLAAPDLARQTAFDAPVLYNFASPRTGSPTFAALVDALPTSWRVVNTYDEVPMLPHPVTVIYHGSEPEFIFYEHIDSAYTITFGVPIRTLEDLGNDHAMCSYYGTLCDQTSDPAGCKARANGLDDCML